MGLGVSISGVDVITCSRAVTRSRYIQESSTYFFLKYSGSPPPSKRDKAQQRSLCADIRRLLDKVLVPDQSRALSREHSRHPRVLVRHAPRCDTDAVGHPDARCRRLVEVVALGQQLRGVRRQREPDVQLCKRDFQTGGGERRERLVHGWDGAVREDQVCLRADSVDRNTVGDKPLCERDHGVYFRPGVVKVVVVDEELRCRVGFLGSAEGDVDEFSPEKVVEYRAPPGAVVVEDLVDYVPVVDLARVPAGDEGDVALDDGRQLGGVGDCGNPCVR